MAYYFSSVVDSKFDDAVIRLKEVLEQHKFRVVSEIDMKDNFKKVLNLEFRPYLLLGVCNPQLTYQALQVDDKMGAMLPCTIVVQQHDDDGRIEVSAVDPVASMQAITHVVVNQVAEELRARLRSVINEVGETGRFSGGPGRILLSCNAGELSRERSAGPETLFV
jgi:uncharacterized protein (DUF302 family)